MNQSIRLLASLAACVVTTASAGPNVVFLIGEREYDTKTTLPAFAEEELMPRGYECIFVHAVSDGNDVGRNQFPGAEAIDEADLLVLSVRRRTLPAEDLARVRKHIADGKPVIALRTASHAFSIKGATPPGGLAAWETFDVDVLGARYDNHLMNKREGTTLTFADSEHPIFHGVPRADVQTPATLYRFFDLTSDAKVLLTGTTTFQGETSTFPVAWTRTLPSGSRIFGSALGHRAEMESAPVRKLLVNTFAWCVDDATLSASPADDALLAAEYGFAPLEVYELDWRTFAVQAGDFNSDGRQDLAVADNRRSRITVFAQRPELASEATSSRPNSLVDPGRFEQIPVLVDREITALASGDVDGDGHVDFVTLESPKRLVVRRQNDRGFRDVQTIRVPDAGEETMDLAVGDLDQDGDADVVILGERTTMLFESRGEDGLTAHPPRLNTSNSLDMLQLLDIDGDGRDDWFYTAFDGNKSHLCYRRQLAEPLTFGPELRLSDDESRALVCGDVDGQPGGELFVIDSQTGRIEMLGFDASETARAGGAKTGATFSDRVTQYGLTGGKQDRAIATGDFDGDGRTDLVVSNPEAAEVILFTQQDTGLSTATLCPSLLGISSLHAADFNDDGRDELLILSEKEKSLGVASWDKQRSRIAFPELIPLTTKDDKSATPYAVCVPDVVAQKHSGFVVIRSSDDKKSVTAATWIWKDEQWWEVNQVSLEQSASDFMAGVSTLDADNDDRTDFLALAKRSGPILLLSDDDGELTKQSGGLSLPRVDRAAIAVSRDERSVLVAQDKFVRRMSLDDASRWQVDEQLNAPSGDASFKAVVEFFDAENTPTVAAYNNKTSQLVIFGDGEPEQIDIGRFQIQRLEAGDFDGDGRDDIVIVGADRVGLVRSSGDGPSLKTRLTFEADDEKAYFADVVTGDINADGITDLIVNETREHTIAIVSLRDNASTAIQAVRFKLFEEKRFSSENESPGLQPREMLIADVTGDGRDDLVMLCHDRLLIHPQDAPSNDP